MALTDVQLAAALRLGDGTTPLVEPEASIIRRLMAVATASVAAYAPNAPEAVETEAIVRFAGYLYDAPPSPGFDGYASAFTNSGAASLLAPYRNIGGGVVGATASGNIGSAVAAAVTSILELSDTPASFAGSAGKFLAVNEGASAVDFVDAPSGGDSTVTDMAFADVGSTGGIITFDRFDGSQVEITIPVYTDANADDRIEAYGQPFTTEEKTKLGGIAEGATVNTTASIDSQINSNARVVDGHEFRESFRRTRRLTAAHTTYTQGISNAAGEITGKPMLPPNLKDTHILVQVTGALTASVTFNLSQLLLKPAVSPTDQLSTTNAIGFGPSQTPVFIARRANGEFLFAASNIGGYGLAIFAIEIDIEDSARLSSTAEYTRAKLPDATATDKGAITENRVQALGSGQTESQVTALIKAGVKDYAETDSTDAIPDDAYSVRHNELVSALEAGGWEQHLTDGQIDAARANKLAGGTVPTGLAWGKTTFEQSPRVTNYYIPVRVLLAHKTDLANWRVIVTETDVAPVTIAGTAWEHIADDSMWAYYQTAQVADLPVGAEVTIERYQPVSFDTSKVQFPADPHAELRVLFDGSAAQGITVTAVTGDRREPLSAFPRNLNLGEHSSGVLLVTAHLTITTRAPTTIGFGGSGIGEITLSGSVALSAIAAASAYDAAHRNGEEVFDQAMAQGGSLAGRLRLMIAKDGSDDVGYYLDYDGNSALSITGNFAASMRLDVELIEQDNAPSSGGGGGVMETLLASSAALPTARQSGALTGLTYTIESGAPFTQSGGVLTTNGHFAEGVIGVVVEVEVGGSVPALAASRAFIPLAAQNAFRVWASATEYLDVSPFYSSGQLTYSPVGRTTYPANTRIKFYSFG